MAVLLIDDNTREQIQELVATAPAMMHDIKEVMGYRDKALADYRAYMQTRAVEIPVGYVATYTHEKQSFGLAHHLSVSVALRGMLPSIPAVEMIMAEFGMGAIRDAAAVWPEDFDYGHKAINIIVPIR